MNSTVGSPARPSGLVPAPGQGQGPLMKPVLNRVLVVDDDEVVLRLVQLSLEKLGGLDVRTVNESANAISTAREYAPDLIVLDWMMPGADGVELFGQIRATPGLEAVPVVFLTVKTHWRMVDDLRKLGAAGVITKPFSARELATQLRTIWASLQSEGDSAR